ncbi:uncharacterized protein LOC143305678 [Osmia lignaria lignaria]|uniref:uncharacterized protein LOC143305678 n=1 Tax=Osmia lignaria lignaria TaxID=1437193 RepID=UPI00402B83A9
MSCEVIVAGDFNTKAVEWGMEPDSRGRRVMEMASRLGLVVLNSGQTSTFRRPGYRQTIVDISFSTEALEARVHDWRVIEDYTSSDHQYITYSVRHRAPRRVYAAQPRYQWRADRADHEALFHALELGKPSLESIPRGTDPRKKAERLASQTMAHIQRASALRGRCLRLRRVAQRARRREDVAPQSTADYKAARRELRHAIRVSQRRCWQQLGDDLNRDPWGLGYRVVKKKLGAQVAVGPMDSCTMRHIVDTLFPDHPKRSERQHPTWEPNAPPSLAKSSSPP